MVKWTVKKSNTPLYALTAEGKRVMKNEKGSASLGGQLPQGGGMNLCWDSFNLLFPPTLFPEEAASVNRTQAWSQRHPLKAPQQRIWKAPVWVASRYLAPGTSQFLMQKQKKTRTHTHVREHMWAQT